MTKKKQSKKSAKQGAKKTSGSGVAPTLHEIPAIEPPQASQDAHALSAPEPIVPEPVATDLAADPQSGYQYGVLGDAAAAPATEVPQAPQFTPLSAKPLPQPSPAVAPAPEGTPVTTESPPAPESPTPEPSSATPTPKSEPTPTQTDASAPSAYAPATMPLPVVMTSPSITNDIPTPPAIAAAQESSSSQKTTYDIEALENAAPAAPAQDIAAAPAHTSPALNPQSLGSLTRSKSSSDVSRGLPSKEEPAPKWRPPVDYFGASASAFSSSFSGSLNRDPNALKRPSDAQQAPTASAPTPASSSTNSPNPPAQPIQPSAMYESGTDTAALSPKMAKFISSLREREMTTASGASSPVVPQMEATSVEIAPIPTSPAQPQPPATPPKISPVTSAKHSEPKMEPKAAPAPGPALGPTPGPAPGPVTAQTARDLTPMVKMPDAKGPRPEPKAFDEELPLAPKSSSQVAELRESIISQRSDGKPEDWHPVPSKKPPRTPDPQLSSELEEFKKPEISKHKHESDRHLSLEEMAALDPDLALPAQTPQQQSIRRLKSKTTGGIHAEIYIPIYIVCLGLSWVTEQSAAAGTCRDAGQRIESALQLLAPKPLADNFVAGSNAYDDRENKLHPFNPNKRPNVFQSVLSRIMAFCSGLSSAFGRIPATIAASSATNPLAEIMILLTYSSILILSLLIFFKFKRSTNWGIADFLLLPAGLIAASTIITAVLIAVLSMSASLAASYLPNTIILYTTVAVVLAVLDMARRSFLGRKQAIVRD